MIDRRFLDANLVVNDIANSPEESPINGTQYIVGLNPSGAFAGAVAGSIARYDDSVWSFTQPNSQNLEVVNAATGELLKYDGSAWNAVASFVEVANDYLQTVSGKALDAVKGKDLNDRVSLLEGINVIDCGEITLS